jgi:hypothetical protein
MASGKIATRHLETQDHPHKTETAPKRRFFTTNAQTAT